VDGVQGGSGSPPAGWYADPEDATQLRYWDGASWTEHRSPLPGAQGSGEGRAGTQGPSEGRPGDAYGPGAAGAWGAGGSPQSPTAYGGSGVAGPPSAPVGGGQAGVPYHAAPAGPAGPTQGLAIAALVLAVLGVLLVVVCPVVSPFLWLAGIVVGILALARRGDVAPPAGVKAMAWVGLAVSALGLVVTVLAILVFGALFAGLGGLAF
jgi:hypothetical protein